MTAKILIVDDLKFNIDLLEEHLQKHVVYRPGGPGQSKKHWFCIVFALWKQNFDFHWGHTVNKVRNHLKQPLAV